MAELKPCKCGGVGIVYPVNAVGTPYYRAECNVCGWATDFYTDIDEAIDAWNKRSQYENFWIKNYDS